MVNVPLSARGQFVWILLFAILSSGPGCSSEPRATSAEQPTDEQVGSDEGGDQSAPPGAPPEDPPSNLVESNRLIDETSPYLRLHAHNPVDWFPWGPEALQKAQQENKVIFLSVGYSSCHWCHVMERESFMDKAIASYLNEHFVCIKVDREERPDIDAIYMTALQTYNRASGAGGGGGWPMSMFLLPDARPFFGGTYFPARDGDRGAGMGFLTLVKRIQEFWVDQPENLRRDAETLTQLVRAEMDVRRPAPLKELDTTVLQGAVDELYARFDATYGGFSHQVGNPRIPKFPEPPNLLFLIAQARSTEAPQEMKDRARVMLMTTLQRMAMGGLRDHLGGGFHRYSVDRFWKIPHFEKMLYDNGQLATVYAEAHALTGEESFRRVVEELLAFVQREMTSDEGGFYAALDAESESVEGKFYRWEQEEVAEVLSDEEYALFADVYQLDEAPNFEGEYYVPELESPLAEIAVRMDLSEAELNERLVPLRAKLLAARNQRPRPLTDTKILTSWNGLMIRGYADAGRILERPEYIETAKVAAEFILEHLRTDENRLLRTFSESEGRLNAYLDDYAFFVDGLIALHVATSNQRWLELADELTEKQVELFWDEQDGGFFFTSSDHESLIARGRDPVDGVEPSGNNVAASNLLFLSRKLGRDDYRQKAERTIQSVAELVQRAPSAVPRLLLVLDEWLAAAEGGSSAEPPQP